MTTTDVIVDQAEEFLRQLSDALERPQENECLCCYVARMLDEFGCDGSHRHALRYRDTRAPRATALLRWLREIGACCCDCELFVNGYQPTSGGDDGDSLPGCAGVRRGSVQPCRNWVRI